MTETMANWYSSDSASRELSNKYQHDRVKMIFRFFLLFCALEESNLSIRRVHSDFNPLMSGHDHTDGNTIGLKRNLGTYSKLNFTKKKPSGIFFRFWTHISFIYLKKNVQA